MPSFQLSPKMRKQVQAKRPATKQRSPIEPAPFDVELDQMAQRFLDTEPQLKGLSEQLALNSENYIIGAADLVSKVTRKQHLKAVTFAYALWLRAARNPAFEQYVAKLRQRRKRYDKRVTDLHLLVEAMVSYGDEPENRNDKRGLYQRDVAAIRYLHSQRIGPTEVDDLATKRGEGLNTWSRQWSKVRGGGVPASSRKGQVDPGIEILIRITAPNGDIQTKRFHSSRKDGIASLLEIFNDFVASKTP